MPSGKSYSLKDNVTQAFEHQDLHVLKYERTHKDWIKLHVDGSKLDRAEVGLRSVKACSLAVDVRNVSYLGGGVYLVELEVDDRTSISGTPVTEIL